MAEVFEFFEFDDPAPISYETLELYGGPDACVNSQTRLLRAYFEGTAEIPTASFRMGLVRSLDYAPLSTVVKVEANFTYSLSHDDYNYTKGFLTTLVPQFCMAAAQVKHAHRLRLVCPPVKSLLSPVVPSKFLMIAFKLGCLVEENIG